MQELFENIGFTSGSAKALERSAPKAGGRCLYLCEMWQVVSEQIKSEDSHVDTQWHQAF